MSREVTLDCDICGTTLPMEHGKEALIKRGENAYHLLDVCATCLDDLLQRAESVNDSSGYRQKAAALISMKAGESIQTQRAS